MRDETLYEKGYNRVYDTIELEQNLDDIERILSKALADVPDGTTLSQPHDLRAARPPARAARRAGAACCAARSTSGVPVFVPAFTDSRARARRRDPQPPAPRGRQAAAAVRPVPRPRRLRGADPRARDARHLHDRRRRAAQLGAAGGPVLRDPARAHGRRRAGAPLQVRGADLPRARPLGRPLRAAATPRACRGGSSCPRRKAAASPRCTPTRRSPGRSSCAR